MKKNPLSAAEHTIIGGGGVEQVLFLKVLRFPQNKFSLEIELLRLMTLTPNESSGGFRVVILSRLKGIQDNP
jgi:hypothetical protein